MQRIQVGILHHEAQPDGPARQLALVTAAFPRHHPFDLVADLFHRVSKREVGQRFARLTLKFDVEAGAM